MKIRRSPITIFFEFENGREFYFVSIPISSDKTIWVVRHMYQDFFLCAGGDTKLSAVRDLRKEIARRVSAKIENRKQ
jgi:hypothetical protein